MHTKSFSSKRTIHYLLVLGSLVLLVAGFRALADERATARLELRGSVATDCTVGVVPTPKASSLDLRGGEQDVTVGVVTEDCNARNGYTVTISSSDRGQLRSSTNGATPASYSVRYDGAAGAMTEQLVVSRDQPNFGRQSNLMVTIPANTSAMAGDYSANLSLVIAAK